VAFFTNLLTQQEAIKARPSIMGNGTKDTGKQPSYSTPPKEHQFCLRVEKRFECNKDLLQKPAKQSGRVMQRKKNAADGRTIDWRDDFQESRRSLTLKP